MARLGLLVCLVAVSLGAAGAVFAPPSVQSPYDIYLIDGALRQEQGDDPPILPILSLDDFTFYAAPMAPLNTTNQEFRILANASCKSNGNESNPQPVVLTSVFSDVITIAAGATQPLDAYPLTIRSDIMNFCTGRVLTVNMTLFKLDSVTMSHVVAYRSFHVLVNSNTLSIIYLICATISTLCCLVLIYLYVRYPLLRQYPSSLVLWRTVADLIFAVQFMYLHSALLANDLTDDSCSPVVAFLAQFSNFASLSWYLVMALNFHFSITNPFVRPESKVPYYHTIVWGLAIITGIVAANQAGYRGDVGLCWVHSRNGMNLYNWFLFFLWLPVYALVPLIILFISSRHLGKNRAFAAATLATRQDSLRVVQTYVTAFSAYWMIICLLWFFLEVGGTRRISAEEPPVAVASLLGVIDVITWLFIQRKNLKQAMLDDRLRTRSGSRLRPTENYHFNDISDALRHEFIEGTVAGIVLAVNSPFVPRKESSRHGSIADRIRRNTERDYLAMEDDETSQAAEIHPLNLVVGEEQHSYRFTAYAPRLFAKLRALFQVSDKDFIASIQGDPAEMQKNFSEGASGCFFYKTSDDKYLVKTMGSEEFSSLRDFLPRYIEHMRENPGSLLSRFFGVYSIQMYNHSQMFAVMENVLCSPDYAINEKYDLKGSRINRHGQPSARGVVSTFKDNDFKKPLRIDTGVARTIYSQLESDTEFLYSLGIMDYSLLLGVHFCSEPRVGKTHCNGPFFPDHKRGYTSLPASLDILAKPRSPSPQSIASQPLSPQRSQYSTDGTRTSLDSPPRSSFVPENARNSPPHVTSDAVDIPVTPQRGDIEPQMEAQSPPMRVFHAADGSVSSVLTSSGTLVSNTVQQPHGSPRRVSTILSSEVEQKEKQTRARSITAAGTSSILQRRSTRAMFDQLLSNPPRSVLINERLPAVVAAAAIEGPGIYHIGLIDILQRWNWKKKAEFFVKALFGHWFDYQWLSSVEPMLYSQRFMIRMQDVFNVDVPENGSDSKLLNLTTASLQHQH